MESGGQGNRIEGLSCDLTFFFGLVESESMEMRYILRSHYIKGLSAALLRPFLVDGMGSAAITDPSSCYEEAS